MIGAIINGIFSLVLKLANFIVSPLVSGILALFPSLGTYLGYITSFLSYSLTYIPFALDLSMIPRQAVVLLFDYYIIKYSVHLLKQAVSFTIKIYNYFKL